MATGCIVLANGDYTGAARVGAAIACGLRDHGDRVVVVCGPRPPVGQPAVGNILSGAGFRVHNIAEINYKLNLMLVWYIRKFIVSEKVDYAITFFVTRVTRHVGLALFGLGIPSISSVQIEIRFVGSSLLSMIKAIGFGLV